ncbi:hypothetical protein Trebr_2108 [Treponema brennaborense DSM 12168]|uniref:Type IV pilus assembly PilZ n=2 Tax=Treponema TaxID=157 RepID=F4LK61_TREBD|nr:hypothetical protein Trebr_2108 [Treponema brennaborense DSM 12168]
MQIEKRRMPRFSDIGRVEAADICIFPGTLIDICMKGCKIRFPIHVTLDMDTEYELTVTVSRKSVPQSLTLIGRPVRLEYSGTSSEIGFQVLRSPDSRLFESYIRARTAEQQSEDCGSDFESESDEESYVSNYYVG